MAANWVAHKLTDEQKRQLVNVARDLPSCLKPGGPKRVADVITGDETGYHSTTSPANAGTKHGWVQTTRLSRDGLVGRVPDS